MVLANTYTQFWVWGEGISFLWLALVVAGCFGFWSGLVAAGVVVLQNLSLFNLYFLLFFNYSDLLVMFLLRHFINYFQYYM